MKTIAIALLAAMASRVAAADGLTVNYVHAAATRIYDGRIISYDETRPAASAAVRMGEEPITLPEQRRVLDDFR